jgi:hypothetical protein
LRNELDIEMVQRPAQMQGVDDSGDIEGLGQPIAGMRSARLAGCPRAEQRDDAGVILWIILRVGAIRQVDVDVKDAGVGGAPPGAARIVDLCDSEAVSLSRATGSSCTRASAAAPATRTEPPYSPTSSVVFDDGIPRVSEIRSASAGAMPSDRSRKATGPVGRTGTVSS